MPAQKSYAFILFLLVLTLIALLGVALLVYGIVTWNAPTVESAPALLSRWEAFFHA